MSKKLFAQRIGLISLTNFLISLSGIILLPIVTKKLPIEEYGVWVQVGVTISLLPVILNLGLPYAMVRFLAAKTDKKEIQEGFYSVAAIVLLMSITGSLLLLLFSKPLAAIFLGNRVDLVKILSLMIPIVSLNAVCLNFFRAFQHIKRYTFFTFLQTYIMLVLVACFLLSGYGIFEAVLCRLLSQIIIFLLMISLIVSNIGIKIPDFSYIKEYLSFGIPTIPGNLSFWIVESSDRYVIGYFLGLSFVGYYSPGYGLGSLIRMFVAPLGFLLPPVLSKLYDENKITEVKIYLEYSLKYFLMFVIPSAFGVSLLSKDILVSLTTPEIASHGYLITSFVAVSTVLYGAYGIVAQIIVLVKKTKITGSIWLMAGIMNLGLNMIFIPYFGIIGAAVTTLIAYIFAFTLLIYYAFKYLKFNIDFYFIMKSILASIIMSLVIIKSNPVGALNILIVIGVCAVVYFVILLLLKGLK
ncbi:MAG TPA: flippase, partial [Candidatus Atribacteria bacterium]|nr:flippase [Candidatus Atribacteria bacterium]